MSGILSELIGGKRAALWRAAIAAALGMAGAVPARADGTSVLVEAEEFQFPGSWTRELSSDCSGGYYLKTANGGASALTAFRLPAAGTYHIWTRSRDYAGDGMGKRLYRVAIDGEPLGKESGAVGKDGWGWEEAGVRDLGAGDHALVLQDTARFFGRCDAVFLTTGDASPDALGMKALAAFRAAPAPVSGMEPLPSPRAADPAKPERKLAEVGNDRIRATFVEGRDGADRPVVRRDIELSVDGKWIPLPLRAGDEALVLLSSAGSKIRTGRYFPRWDGAVEATVTIAGKSYPAADAANPFRAGTAAVLTPESARQLDPATVEVAYADDAGHRAVTQWKTVDGAAALAVAATFTAAQAGEYSLGFKAFQAWKRDEVEFDLLPPLYQYQRLPASPCLLTSTVTPQPLALVQTRPAGFPGPVSLAVEADPSGFPFEWATPTNARYGFSLLDEGGRVEPCLFVPVLGLPDSRLQAGEARTVRWNLAARPGDWRGALQEASDRVFAVRDYRSNAGTSLTEAAFNIVDLIKDDKACGWDARLKGFWNIESPMTASQAAPLALLSAALLTRDEEFYRTRALPAIEFVLSRPKPHFAAEMPKAGGAITPGALRIAADYIPPQALQITIPSTFFGTSFWQGVDALLGGKTAWVRGIAFQPDGKVRHAASYGAVPLWSDLLAAYRLDPTPERLAAAEAACDQFLKAEVEGRKTNDLGIMPFYNVSFYPYWWDLLDLYAVDPKPAYLAAAEFGAGLTIAGLWSHPLPPEGDAAVNSPRNFAGKERIWWKGEAPFRLGYPLKPGDLPERKAPAWTVAQVGLGLEQPVTYYGDGDETGMRNIQMAAWAPNLLRLAGATGNDFYRTYARNAAVGRFANYPGYYLHGYTDTPNDPRFPDKGPDVNDIYFHHIAAHLAFAIDYLVTEAAVRSGGKIAFPWAKQQGYVWFSNRVYGDLPGTVYGRAGMSLWLDRAAAKVGSDQLNYLTARGPDSWALILMNESDAPVTCPVALDAAKTGVIAGKGWRVVADGAETARDGAFDGSATVSPKGITVLVFPAAPAQPVFSAAAPPLGTAPETRDLGGDWGTLHAFRIRSPFGHDSLYAVLTGHPPAGAKAALLLDGDDVPRSLDSFPYEFTVYPWPLDKEMAFRLRLTDAQGRETVTDPVRLAGTPSP